MFDATAYAEPDQPNGIWVLFDDNDPKGPAFCIRMLDSDDRITITQKHTKRRKVDIAGANAAMHHATLLDWKRVTPKWLGKMAPHKWPPHVVAQMEEGMRAEGLTEIPFGEGLRDLLLQKSITVSSRMDEFEVDAAAVADAAAAFQKGETGQVGAPPVGAQQDPG